MLPSLINTAHYQQQLDTKARRITAQFAKFNPPTLEVYSSPVQHFRMRAEFKVWHQGDECYFVMFDPQQPKSPVRVDDFPIGSALINQLMKQIITEIRISPLLRHKLFQIEFLTTLSGQALVTLIYHKALSDEWQQLGENLQQRLGVKLIGRSHKQKKMLSDDYVTECLHVAGKHYQWQQVENSFTQPNAEVNQKMLEWALSASKNNGGDLIELYCGNGNFTVVLAQNFAKILATEISKTSVRSANFNFALNQISNVQVVRMSSEDFSSALAQERAFRRLQDIDLGSYHFSTILVDPPRAGLDPHTEQLVSRFENILYISCNPETLHNNLAHICKSHRIERFAIFDQFPYTDHIECGVMLRKHTAGENS